MRRMKNIWVLGHFDWYTYDKSGKGYQPTDKAPPEAIEAIEKLNQEIKEYYEKI